jgi:hypothetical protein
MIARTAPAAALAALALIATGCTTAGSTSSSSTGNFKGEQKLVANTIDDLSTAASKRNQGQICSTLLASDIVDRLDARGGCTKLINRALKDADTYDISVRSIQINGDKATAQVTSKVGNKDRPGTLQLVKQDGRWKVSSFG